MVPGEDLVAPAAKRPAEPAHFGWVLGVEEIVDELVEVGLGLRGVGLGVEAAEGLLGVPREADLSSWVAGLEQAAQLLLAVVVEAFVAVVSRRRDR